MLLISWTMGCGRSKQQSPKNGEQNLGVNGTKEKGAGKKKKSKGEKKENKDAQKGNEKSAEVKTSTGNKSNNSLLKPPATTVNGSSQQTLTIDVEYPGYKDKMDKLAVAKSKDGKEVTGKQANIKVTHSQIEFFKMLDEKIEQVTLHQSCIQQKGILHCLDMQSVNQPGVTCKEANRHGQHLLVKSYSSHREAFIQSYIHHHSFNPQEMGQDFGDLRSEDSIEISTP